MLSEFASAFSAGLRAPFVGVVAALRAKAFDSRDLKYLALHNGALFLGSVALYELLIIPFVLREIPSLSPSVPWAVLVLVWLLPLWMCVTRVLRCKKVQLLSSVSTGTPSSRMPCRISVSPHHCWCMRVGAQDSPPPPAQVAPHHWM